MAGAPVDYVDGGLYGLGAEPVQGLLAGLSRALDRLYNLARWGVPSVLGGSDNVVTRRELHEHDLMTRDQRRALQLLADVPCGIAESLMLAHGFSHELISGLVLLGLATMVTDTVRIGGEKIEVELIMITDDGRRVLESATARRPSPRSPGAR